MVDVHSSIYNSQTAHLINILSTDLAISRSLSVNHVVKMGQLNMPYVHESVYTKMSPSIGLSGGTVLPAPRWQIRRDG